MRNTTTTIQYHTRLIVDSLLHWFLVSKSNNTTIHNNDETPVNTTNVEYGRITTMWPTTAIQQLPTRGYDNHDDSKRLQWMQVKSAQDQEEFNGAYPLL